MAVPKIKTGKKINPMIYAYTTPNDHTHDGWTKIGYTDKQTPEERIHQQTHTADVKVKILWKGSARYTDGSNETFDDHDFHKYLTEKRNVERKKSTEWFRIDGSLSREYYHRFADRDYSDLQGKEKEGTQYELRREQKKAVEKTMKYFESHGEGSEFLWNAKPRFGKTLTTYDLVRRMKLGNILIVTNRPSIANSWFDDYEKFIGWQTKYYFVSENDALTGALSRDEYIRALGNDVDGTDGQIAFESLQGLKGSCYFGGGTDKLKWIYDTVWDLLVVDEAHEGVDTIKTDKAFENIKCKYTLHLSGTPFKALANGKFSSDQIYNWSYADEQRAKRDWDEEEEGCSNPYDVMPRLNMFTYQMSSLMEQKAERGIDLDDGEHVNPAFDLNEFFRTDSKGKFVYEEQVDHFLDALTTQEKFPFSTPELRNELRHTFWLLNRVASARALAEKLENHPVFSEYKVIVAAGNVEDDENEKKSRKAFDLVQRAISEYDKTITLSVGQLTTGVTVKPWTGVMMLSSMKSPSEYMQAAFRAQNPYTYEDEDGSLIRKENAYVFDFDPTRTLRIFDEFANNLSVGNDSDGERRENIKELLNFFPVIGEDEAGRMVELDANQVMTIPNRLKAGEVVNRGFMSNFLFSNISRIFSAPDEVRRILGSLVKAREERNKAKSEGTVDDIGNVKTDENGNAVADEDRVIGMTGELFGKKIFHKVDLPGEFDGNAADEYANGLAKTIDDSITSNVVNEVRKKYKLDNKQAERLREEQNRKIRQKLQKHVDDFNVGRKIAENEAQKQLENVETEDEKKKAENDLRDKMIKLQQKLQQDAENEANEFIRNAPEEVVRRVEQNNAEKQKRDIEEDARSHLRGFSRTIPSFIMAYGDRNLTLSNFDDYTEDDVFEEVTGITEEQFRFLRDGGDYTDGDEVRHFDGHLFDEAVFNDSIQKFLDKKEKLANYFDESSDEDIFDYIPAQKTNQIYTPKAVVRHMVDDLEENNPGIFDDPDRTFADLYMKSGLYITEIVKRLFRSEEMKKIYPDDNERVRHILEHQVYGLAPTRIIYRIAVNYIFGFDEKMKQSGGNNHFKMIDAAELAKDGTLEEVIQKEFGDSSD